MMKSTSKQDEDGDWFLQQKKLFESGLLTDEQVCCFASLARKFNVKLNPPENMFENKCQKLKTKR